MTELGARETFDPYHKWLGTSPKDQPPHYYRLLAIDPFESDFDVISAAADKQMAFIRSFQTGTSAALSQKILNEIAKARVCLLNAAKKEEYDVALRARFAAAGAASGIKRAKPLPVAAEVPAGEAVLVVSDLADRDIRVLPPLEAGKSRRSQTIRKKTNSASIIAWGALSALAVICAVAAAVVMTRMPETPGTQLADDREGGTPDDADASRRNSTTPVDKPQAGSLHDAPASRSKHQPPGMDEPSAGSEADGNPFLGKVDSGSQPEPSVVSKSDTATQPGLPVIGKVDFAPQPELPAEPEKIMTLEELDKQLADAQTPEEFQAVAGEALRAAVKAIDDHQVEAARPLILKALLAARKSGDSKLIIQATRAVTKPESVKEILAENEKQDEDSARAAPPHVSTSPPPDSARGTVNQPPPVVIHRAPAVPGTKRIGLSGSQKIVTLIGAVRQGTLITLKYDGGVWTDRATHESFSPDDASQNVCRVAIASRDASPRTSLVSHGTANRAYQWRADRDFDSLVLRCHLSSANRRLTGKVYYLVTISVPGQ